MKVIWHQGGWNRNFGDWVIFDSVHHHLARACPEPVSFVPVDGHVTRYSPELIERLNAEADLLLLGSGGLIFHRPEDGSLSGWQFNISLDDLRRIEVPIVVYGVGFNRFSYDPAPFPDTFAPHLRAVQEQAALFSVRNTGTRDALVEYGLDAGRIRVVPDAGIFAPARPPNLPDAVRAGRWLIGVNLAGDRPEHRYPPPAERSEAACTKALAEALRRVCAAHDARVLLVPHIRGLDERRHDTLRAIVGARYVFELPEVAPHVYGPGAVTAPLLVGTYGLCDLVVGERGHACLIALGRGVPFFALSSHRKTRFLLADIDRLDAELRPEDMVSGELSAEEIAARLSRALEERERHVAALQGVLEVQRQRFEALNRDVAQILRGGRPIPPGPIRLLVLDFDGVLTDNHVWVDERGSEAVCCTRADGLAFHALAERGIPAVVISKESNPVVAVRCRKLGVECHRGVDDKLALLRRVAAAKAVPLAETCYLGNDLPDLPCVQAAGIGAAVADAHADVRRAADYVTRLPGGKGAVRELVEWLAATQRLGRASCMRPSTEQGVLVT